MKRLLIGAAATLALAATGPATALAHPGGHHLRRDHREHALVERFSHHHSVLEITTTTPGVAGKILSHAGSVVTVQLLNGSTVSGKLTDGTELLCVRHVRGGLTLAHCSPGDARPPRRIAGGLLDITPTGNLWQTLIVWD